MKTPILILALSFFMAVNTYYTAPANATISYDILLEDDELTYMTEEEFLLAFEAVRMANIGRGRRYGDMLHDSFARDSLGNIIFPDFYGCGYFDNNGNLVINIVSDIMPMDEASYFMRDLLGDSHTVIIKPARFSLNEINRAMDTIYHYLFCETVELTENLMSVRYNFNGCGTKASVNGIVVLLIDDSEEQVSLFRKYVFDSPMLVFVGLGARLERVLDI